MHKIVLGEEILVGRYKSVIPECPECIYEKGSRKVTQTTVKSDLVTLTLYVLMEHSILHTKALY